MSVRAVIKEARVLHEKHNLQEEVSLEMFTNGANWLHQYHNIIVRADNECPKRTYEYYGWLKYGLSAFAFFIVIVQWVYLGFVALFAAVFAFYWMEFHFLFLFPIAIEGHKNLWLKTLKATYQFGLIKSFLATIRIAIYMLFGLFNFKEPFKKWRIGCLAVLILYHNEIRNRS